MLPQLLMGTAVLIGVGISGAAFRGAAPRHQAAGSVLEAFEGSQQPTSPQDKSLHDERTLERLPRDAVELARAKQALLQRIGENSARTSVVLGQKIVCGMIVIEVDPSIDPEFVHHPPAGGPDSKIRRIEPSICSR